MMKINPIIMERIKTRHTNYIVDFILKYNITFIAGDSGVGKSAVYSFLREESAENNTIKCFNYLDQNKGYKNSIKNSKGKLFVIDNADLLLNDDMRRYIAMDSNNQYIIIGRNPSGLLLGMDEIFELYSETINGITTFHIKTVF